MMAGRYWSSSGKARPMPSPSTTGRPILAAVTSGSMELIPPISKLVTAEALVYMHN